MRACVWRFLLLAAIVAVANKPAAASVFGTVNSLMPAPANPVVGQTVAFAFTTSGDGPFIIAFGDGSSQLLMDTAGTVYHAYSTIGFKEARLCQVNCMSPNVLAVAFVTVRAPAPKVPFGVILGTSVVGGPFIAGGDAQIDFSFRVATQSFEFASTSQADFQVIVDLEDTHGHLVRRSDPMVIESVEAAGGFPVQESIPYSIPGDAKGAYRLRVYLRTNDSAAVAVGQPTPIFIFGGPDPAQDSGTSFHANGSIITGPTTTTTGPNTFTSTQFQSDMTTALEWPDKTLALTGIYDPVSKRTDGILALTSATPSPITAPDALAQNETSPASATGGRPQYDDVFGRALTSLPQLLGSGEVLRGLDLTYKYADGWAYHGAAGYTQLGTFATSLQRGDAFDVTRTWSNDDTLRAAFFSQSDDVTQFVPNGTAGPQASSVVVLEFAGPIVSDLNALVSAGRSQSHLLMGSSLASTDSADRVGLQYTLGSVNIITDYHNYGADFAVGGGPGAMSDVAGSSATASANISPTASVNLAWLHDVKHSAFSDHTNESATFSALPPGGFGASISVTRDRMLIEGSAMTTNSLTYAFDRTWQTGSTFSLNGTAAGSSDASASVDATHVRTTNVAFTQQRGPQLFGGGISASEVAGPFSKNSTVSENLDFGFSFGGRLGDTRFNELQLQALGGNSVTNFSSPVRTSLYTMLLSRHLSRHSALSVRLESGRTIVPGFNELVTTSAIRLQLNLNL